MYRVTKKWAGAGLFAAVSITAATLSGCTSGGAAGVQVAPVGYSTVAQVVQAPANIVPKAQVSVPAADDGTVTNLAVRDGQHVTAGQLLGTVSSPAAQQRLASAKKAAEQASSGGSGVVATSDGFTEAAYTARSSADRSFKQAKKAANEITDPTLRKALLDQISATQSSYDSAISAVTATITQFQDGLASASQVLHALGQAQETQAQAAVDVAQRTVDALTVKAPISGVVTLGNGQASAGTSSLGSLSQLLSAAGSGSGSGGAASALGSAAAGALGGSGGSSADSGGSIISAGSPVHGGGTLFTVTDASTLSVTAQVDETDVLTVKAGVRAHIQLNAVPGADYPGTVTAVDPNSTTSTQGGVSYTVRISLGAGTLPDGSRAPVPLPGMSAIADLDVATVQNALSVPSAALVTDGNVTSVWLVQKGVAHKTAIRLGAQGDKSVQVLSGLTAGDRVVVAGADKVSDGEHVG